MSVRPGERHRAARYIHLAIGFALYAVAAGSCALTFRSLWYREWWHALVAVTGAMLSNSIAVQFIKHQNKLNAQDEEELKQAKGSK